MTTTVYMRSSRIGYVELFNGISAFIGDAPIEVDEFCDHVIEKVNSRLPKSMAWYPETSEIWIDVNDESDIEIEQVWELIEEAAYEVEAEFYPEAE